MDIKDKIIIDMANDLNIERFIDESDLSFHNRLLYSALTQWLRFSILDATVDSQEKNCKSKHYLTSRGNEILGNLLKVFPECQEYFYHTDNNGTSHDDPIPNIRQKMLDCGELIELRSNNRVGLPQLFEESVFNGLARFNGLITSKSLQLKYVGVTKVRINEGDNSILNHMLEPQEFFDTLVTNAIWEKYTDITEFEFFNSKLKRVPHRCWDLNGGKKPKAGVYLARLQSKLIPGKYDYFLFKSDGVTNKISKLDDYHIEWRNYRRLIMALRSKAKNSIRAKIIKRSNLVELQLFAGLPMMEEIILNTYAWPKGNIYSKTNYYVSNEVWPLIRTMLTKLEIEIREK